MKITANSIIKIASKFGYYDFHRIENQQDKIRYRFDKNKGKNTVMDSLLKEVKMQIINDIPINI